MSSRWSGIVALVAVTVVSVGTLRAFCPYPSPKVCSRFFASDAVFVARVLSKRYVDNDDSIRFDVRVTHTLRGTVRPTESIYAGNDSARLPWDVGQEYVVFARREGTRLISSDDCGPLSRVGNVAAIVRDIRALSRRTSASIEGEVVWQPSAPEKGIAGVPVRVSDGRKTYSASTDAHGWFRIEVPPGRYRVIPDPRLRRGEVLPAPDDDIPLVAGQCALFEYVPRDPSTFVMRHPASK